MISGSIMEMNAAAVIRCQPLPYALTNDTTTTVIGAVFGPENNSATSRSFQTHMNWKMAMAAMAGVVSGRMMRAKMPASPAPSMRPDSSSSYGMPDMKLRRM